MTDQKMFPLFRGKEWYGGWVQGLYFKVGDKTEIIEIVEDKYTRFHEVNPRTVGMWTGQVDKNGVKIFGSLPGTKGGDMVRYFSSCRVGEIKYGKHFYEGGYENFGFYIDVNGEAEEDYHINWQNDLKVLGPACDYKGG